MVDPVNIFYLNYQCFYFIFFKLHLSTILINEPR